MSNKTTEEIMAENKARRDAAKKKFLERRLNSFKQKADKVQEELDALTANSEGTPEE